MDNERQNVFELALNVVGGRLDRSITHDDFLSSQKDKNVLDSIISKEKKIEYIYKQFEIYTSFLDDIGSEFVMYAAEISKNNETLFKENTHIYALKAKLCRAVIIDFFYDEFNEYTENIPNDTDFDDINACMDFIPSLYKVESNKNILDLCRDSFKHGLRKRRLDIILDDLNRIEHTNKEQILMKEISYSSFGQLRKYFNHGNCYECTPTELYHWFDMSFKGFKDEVLTNLISIPLHGKIPYLENLKMILEEDYTYLEGNRSEIDALFKKYNTSEDEFLNHNITDVNANEYFNDYMTSNKDFRNGISKSEVDEIHAHIFDYYGASTKNKAIQFIDIQWQRIDPNHTGLINGNDSANEENTVNIEGDAEKHEHIENINDNESIINQINRLLSKYCNYNSKGDLSIDFEYVKSMGYDDTNCSSKGVFCPNCVFSFLRYEIQCKIIRQNHPFNSYQDKLDLIIKNSDLFNDLVIQTTFNDIFFTTYPQNEKESDVVKPLIFKQSEQDNFQKRLSGQKDIQGIPIVSFAELKCILYQKGKVSPDPKLLLENELNRILSLFPKGNVNVISSTFWYLHDLKVNVQNHIIDMNDGGLSIGYKNYGALLSHYLDYYFYIKGIIESTSQTFFENLKFVQFDYIYFDFNKIFPLGQKEKEEILYSGKYIELVCCSNSKTFLSNILEKTKVTHADFNMIHSVFTDHGYWEFSGLKFNTTNSDPDPSCLKLLIDEIFSISENLSDYCREIFLIEFKNLVVYSNTHPDYKNILRIFERQFQMEFDKIFKIKDIRAKSTSLTPLDYMLRVINENDNYIINEFGRLPSDYEYNDVGSWQNVNPFFVYNHISDRFLEFKDYIFAQILNYQSTYDKKAFLRLVENKLRAINYRVTTIEDVLTPYGVIFTDLFEKTNNKLAIVSEIKYDSECILDIERTKGKDEADRIFGQKLDIFHYMLYYWGNKALNFILEQLSDLVHGNENIGFGLSNQSNAQSKASQKEQQFPETDTTEFNESDEDSFKDDNELDIDNVDDNQILKPKTKVLSFTYKNLLSGSENLNKLMNFLKSKEFINKETSSADFKAVFSNSIIKNKIIWDTNISDLAYFIKCVHNKAKKVENTKQKHWDITINCFVIPKDKEPLNKSRLRQQKIPATRASIETAVNLL